MFDIPDWPEWVLKIFILVGSVTIGAWLAEIILWIYKKFRKGI